jgi:hypothetical protein
VKIFVRTLLLSAIVLCTLAAASNAQTRTINMIGSSGLFLESGEAAYSEYESPLACAWSTGTSGLVVATDTSTGSSLTDTGNSWVVWVPSGSNTCATNATPLYVYGFLQTDSVVGNRCLFNAQASNSCTISYAAAGGTSPAGKIEGGSEVSLPADVAASLTAAKVNVAATDIRPEDAEFAITRALTPCGSTEGGTGSIAPYLGLGYANGGTIESHFSSSTFNVINFTLPSKYYVTPVGFDPILVVVNSTDPSGTGFNNSGIKNISSSNLAAYLDGSIGTTSALLGPSAPQTPEPTTVIVREPLSGTYNTMEYNVPNTTEMQTSQDVGVNQLSSQQNCSGTVVGSNPMAIENTIAGSWRYRAIGTGQELAETFATNDALGYGFWGVSNYAAAPSTAKYLEVDGHDPIQATYTDGVIPTTSTELSKVTFTNLANGEYPIWSLVRFVTADTTSESLMKTLAVAAGTFSGATHPDFLPYYNSKGAAKDYVERSHFAPPGINFSATNQPANNGDYDGYGGCTTAEAGGDVGGVILVIDKQDQTYCTDTGSTYGMINRRR